MTIKNGDLPAMPTSVFQQIGDVKECTSTGGLTKREMFAMAAMQGFCTQNLTFKGMKDLAVQSVEIADALLAELEK